MDPSFWGNISSRKKKKKIVIKPQKNLKINIVLLISITLCAQADNFVIHSKTLSKENFILTIILYLTFKMSLHYGMPSEPSQQQCRYQT